MSWLARLFNVFRPDTVSDEIEREVAFHLAERAEELEATGMQPDAARREARRRFGNPTVHKETTRDRDLLLWVEALVADMRYACRGFRRAPAFTAVAVLSLALGIGANTAIFTLINNVMLKSLPVDRPDELVILRPNTGGKGGGSFTHAVWQELRDRQDVFAGIFAYASTSIDLSTGGEARRVPLAFVSGSFFSTLGVGPAIGRPIVEADDRPGCPGIAVISHAFWRREYGGRPDIVGTPLVLDGHPFQIIGVADPVFFGIEYGYHVPIWAPLCSEAIVYGAQRAGVRSGMGRLVMARVKPGLTLDQIRARMSTLAPAILEGTLPPNATAEAVERYRRMRFDVLLFSKGRPDLQVMYGQALLTLMAGVGVVLLIACANIANLLLARAMARDREMAVRLALGASRSRLVRQLLTESLLLSSLGASAGIVFGMWGSRVLVDLLSRSGNPISLDLPLDRTVLGFTILMETLTGLLFGLAPVSRVRRVKPYSGSSSSLSLGAGGRAVAGGQSRFSAGKALIVAQLALSLVSVTGAGLLVGSWRRLATTDPGFSGDRVLLVDANIRATRTAPDRRASMYEGIVQRLRSIPGVEHASAVVRTPMGSTRWDTKINVEGFTASSDAEATVEVNEVASDYFATIGTSMLAGRDFSRRDLASSTEVAIVSEQLARRFFGGASPIGRRVRAQPGREPGPPVEIVGVVADIKDRSLREDSLPMMYYPLSQDLTPGQSFNFAIRAAADASAIAPQVKAAFQEIDPRISLTLVTLDRQIAETLRLPRTLGVLAGFFGVAALLLATIGFYGIMSYTVARRRNEIGVRIALGAARGRVVGMVIADVGRLVAAGIVIGILLTISVTGVISRFLYGVAPNDPVTLALSALTLIVVGIAAGMIPARRAARLDPVSALRAE